MPTCTGRGGDRMERTRAEPNRKGTIMADVNVKTSNLGGGVLGDLSRQWASRPADERITGPDSWAARMEIQRLAELAHFNSKAIVVSTHAIHVTPDGDDGLVLTGPNGGAVAPSYWGMTQLCQRAGVPAGYLREGLHGNPRLAAECLNYGMRQRANDKVQALIVKRDLGAQLRACTGPTYGRIWNKDVLAAANKILGPEWTVPGIFGQAVGAITQANTSLFLSDQDMFIGLSDEGHKIEVPNRRNGKMDFLSRGILIGNSEVGAATLKIWGFYFDYCCANRNFWGVEDLMEVSIRHTSGAPARFLSEARPAIRRFMESSTVKVTDLIEKARQHKLPDAQAFLRNVGFTRPASQAIIEVHKREEQRPIETIWDAEVGATAWARDLPWQDERLSAETLAAKIMKAA